MAALTTQTIRAPFAATPTAGQLHFTFAAGATGGDTITVTGREVIIAYNSHATTAYTFTITSQVDGQNRTGDITTYSLAAGEFAVFSGALTNAPGWKNVSTGLLSVAVSNAAIKWAILQLPAGYPG